MIAPSAEAERKPICDEAETLIRDALERRASELRTVLAICESPIEQLLAVALWDIWDCRVENGRALAARLDAGEPKGIWRIVVEPQRVINANGHRFRSDFLISLFRSTDRVPGLRHGSTVVETDGHEWHERTKFQAARDRQRDRSMVLDGFRVLRFSGSEVFRDAGACAEEVREAFRRVVVQAE